MRRTHLVVPVALTLAVTLAPAAFARQHQGGGGGSAANQAQSSTSRPGMLPGGISIKGQIDHAYGEAVSAQSSLAMGMDDMAHNHLQNVRIVLNHLASQDKAMDSNLRNRLAALRQAAEGVNLEGDRTQALKSTTDLVDRFSTFYGQTASAMAGGGGGGRMMVAPSEALAEALHAASKVQSAVAGRNWEIAQLHARDLVAHLDTAEKGVSMESTKEQGRTTASNELRTLRQEATRLSEAVNARQEGALKQAGTMVNRLARVMPTFAEAAMGGGAGTSNR